MWSVLQIKYEVKRRHVIWRDADGCYHLCETIRESFNALAWISDDAEYFHVLYEYKWIPLDIGTTVKLRRYSEWMFIMPLIAEQWAAQVTFGDWSYQ